MALSEIVTDFVGSGIIFSFASSIALRDERFQLGVECFVVSITISIGDVETKESFNRARPVGQGHIC